MLLENVSHPFAGSQHTYLKNFLTKLGESDFFSVCVKDIKDKKVCLYNSVCGAFWDLPDGAMHGMTAREILTRVPNFINVENELENIEKHEQIAVETRKPSLFQHVLLSYAGFVQARQAIVVPLSGISNRLIATAGIALDITQYIHPLELFGFYSYYYPKRGEAVIKCCEHLKLDTYFYQPLSREELRTLLVMVDDYRHKKIAESLEIAVKTVANYTAAIRAKLRSGFEIYNVLHALRAQKQWRFETLPV